ncbi:MAG: hypothetical protein HZC37_01640 [Burkholderiales bacterium]|nr:hypothetical protein [Burkholderiales bacterium]
MKGLIDCQPADPGHGDVSLKHFAHKPEQQTARARETGNAREHASSL